MGRRAYTSWPPIRTPTSMWSRPMGQGVHEPAAPLGSRRGRLSRRRRQPSPHPGQMIFVLAYVSDRPPGAGGRGVGRRIGRGRPIAGPVARLVEAADRVAGGRPDRQVGASRRHRGDRRSVPRLQPDDRRSSVPSERRCGPPASRPNTAAASSRRCCPASAAGVIGARPVGAASRAVNARALWRCWAWSDDQATGPVPDRGWRPELEEVAARAAAQATTPRPRLDLRPQGASNGACEVRASRRTDGGLVLTFDDITRLVTAQRNAAWRDVARRIAHEIKNPLTPIQLSAERIRRKYRAEITSDLETFDRCTDTIVRQVGDIGRMVDEFSAFARMPAPQVRAGRRRRAAAPGGVRPARRLSRHGRATWTKAEGPRPSSCRRPHGRPGPGSTC